MSIYVSSIEVTGDLRESIIWRVEEMSAVDSWVGSKLERRLSTHRVVLVKESRLTLPPLCLTALSSLPTVPGLFPQLSTATDNWERLTAPSFTWPCDTALLLGRTGWPWTPLPPWPAPPLFTTGPNLMTSLDWRLFAN